MGRILRAAVGLTLAIFAVGAPVIDRADAQTAGPTASQSAKKSAKSAPAAKSGGEDGEGEGGGSSLKSYDAGVRAWQSGKADLAVQQLNGAIGAGKLPPQQMAKALYYRGLAQRKLGKPAMAISDLQSALWLKGALSDAERNDALAARAAAYKEAGIADPLAGKASESAAVVTNTPPPVASPPPPRVSAAQPESRVVPERRVEPEPVSPSVFGETYAPPLARKPDFNALKSQPPTPAPAPVTPTRPQAVAVAPPPAIAAAPNWQTNVRGTTRPAAPAPTTTAALAPPPAPMPAAPSPTVRSAVPAVIPAPIPAAAVPARTPPPVAAARVEPPAPAAPRAEPVVESKPASGGFLSSLFGGISAGSGMPPSPAMPPARTPPPPRVDEDPDLGKSPEGAAPARTRPPGASRVSSLAPTTTGSTAAAKPAATYRLQVASAKSRQEADQVAARIKREQSKAVGQRTVDVDQSAGEGVWRVRVGPYASANEPRNLCVKLRQSGFDCMVVTQ